MSKTYSQGWDSLLIRCSMPISLPENPRKCFSQKRLQQNSLNSLHASLRSSRILRILGRICRNRTCKKNIR